MGIWLRLKGELFTSRWYQKIVVWMTPAGLLATLGGWYTAEMGRATLGRLWSAAHGRSGFSGAAFCHVVHVAVDRMCLHDFLCWVSRFVYPGRSKGAECRNIGANGFGLSKAGGDAGPARAQRSRWGVEVNFPNCAAAITLFALVMYTLLDGFDLGVGALLSIRNSESDRDLMVSAIAPTWDGNETWLIFAGVCLLGAFPLAYSVLLPALYLPLICMLMALGFRGVSFEFRFQTETWRPSWDRAFAGGSIVAALCQGIVLGGVIEGVRVENGAFAGGVFDVMTPFSLLVGVTVVIADVVTGAGWLYYKTGNDLQAFAAGAFAGRRSDVGGPCDVFASQPQSAFNLRSERPGPSAAGCSLSSDCCST